MGYRFTPRWNKVVKAGSLENTYTAGVEQERDDGSVSKWVEIEYGANDAVVTHPGTNTGKAIVFDTTGTKGTLADATNLAARQGHIVGYLQSDPKRDNADVGELASGDLVQVCVEKAGGADVFCKANAAADEILGATSTDGAMDDGVAAALQIPGVTVTTAQGAADGVNRNGIIRRPYVNVT